jgi:hypothetical protein
LLPLNWRVAETILAEAAATEPFFCIDTGLKDKLRRAREDEKIISAIHRASCAGLEVETEETRKLTQTAAVDPDEIRDKSNNDAFDNPTKIVTASDLAVKVSQSFDSAFGIQRFSLPWRIRVVIATSAWNGLKNLAAMIATTAMLGISGFLIWQHSSRPSFRTSGAMRQVNSSRLVSSVRPETRSAATLPVTAKTNVSSEEAAWEIVKTSDDATSIRSFLISYPVSSHAFRAKVKLASIEWNQLDKTDTQVLEDYLRLNPETPYKAEAQRLILAIKAERSR